MADPIPSTPSPLPAPQPPKAARRRKWRLMIGIILALLVLAGIIVGAVILLRQSVDVPPEFTGLNGEVPLSEDSGVRFEDETPAPTASIEPIERLSSSPLPSVTPTITETRQESLAITVRYVRGQTFDLAIESLERTNAYPSKNLEPAPNEPFSVIKIFDGEGRVLVQQRFSIVTEVHVEEFAEGIEIEDVPLAENEDTYILGLPAGAAKPGAVVVETGSGQVLDQQSFTYEQLPEHSFSPRATSHWWDWLRGIPTAWAQIKPDGSSDDGNKEDGNRPDGNKPDEGTGDGNRPDEGTGDGNKPDEGTGDGNKPDEGTGDGGATFKIVVTNDLGGPISALERMFGNTQVMAAEINPWKAFSQRQQVEVVRLQNSTTELGCGPILTTSGALLPGCPSDSRVGNFVSNHGQGGDQHPDWDAIIVVVNVSCRAGATKGCGASIFNSGVVGVGSTGGVPALVAHELGHAVRGAPLPLQDEYLGDLGIKGDAAPPNCFATQDECLRAIAPYEGDGVSICTVGCNSAASWRPANQIMYAAVAPHGGVECAVMDKNIAGKIPARPTGACLGEEVAEPGEDAYWGWFRGGAY